MINTCSRCGERFEAKGHWQKLCWGCWRAERDLEERRKTYDGGGPVTDPLLNATEVSEILQLPVDHVYRLARERRIPCLRFGRSLRFREESVRRWLDDLERGPK
jgi:excisionase family DNA binding protein